VLTRLTVGKTPARSPSKKGGAAWCLLFSLLASVGIHVFVFRTQFVGSQQSRPSATQTHRPVLSARLVAPRATPAPATAATVLPPEGEIQPVQPNDGPPANTKTPGQTSDAAEPLQPAAPGISLHPVYYATSDLSEHPDFKDSPSEDIADQPDPDHAGKITITLFISGTGIVERTETEVSTLTSAQEHWLLNRLKAARLAPGRISGAPVPSKWTLEFALTPDSDTSTSPSGSR
jgi:hypothetical protein